MDAAADLAPVIGARGACAHLGVPPATFYRRRRGRPHGPRPKPKPQPRALCDAERAQVLEVCHSSRFIDAAPASIVATLLDEGTHLASERTFYRLLTASGEVRERRNQLTHPPYATGPAVKSSNPNVPRGC